jgi:hypothetical protein
MNLESWGKYYTVLLHIDSRRKLRKEGDGNGRMGHVAGTPWEMAEAVLYSDQVYQS